MVLSSAISRVGFETVQELAVRTPSHIVMLVMDGLGGLPHPETGKSELETAHTPNLDALAAAGECGLTDPVAPGITPGSGPSHLALFGYDPFRYLVGRGVLEAVGIDFPLAPQDLAIRGNFCTIDAEGRVVDRRAGRIPTEETARLCRLLGQIQLEGVQLFVEPVREHRFVLVLRPQDGSGAAPALEDALTSNDPEREGHPLLPIEPLEPRAQATAALINRFVEAARAILSEQPKANMVLLRGYSHVPSMPSMRDVYRLTPAAVARYPMYRGLARLVGMEVLPGGQSLADQIEMVRQRWNDFDFFYVHVKETDTAGEDGDFQRKVAALEMVDAHIPSLRDLGPEVLIVTGDHSTPAIMAAHSWHPVPTILCSRWGRSDGVTTFSERACAQGALGRIPATALMPLALAHAGKLVKYGA